MKAPYTRSNGETVDAEDMHLAHLDMAIKKMERNDPGNPQLPAMKESYDRRKAIWDEEHLPEQRG